MKSFTDGLLAYIDGIRLTTRDFILGFGAVVFVRFFLESISSPPLSGAFAVDAPTLVHYTLFYFSAFVALALIVGAFVRDIPRASRLLFAGLPVLWLSPVIDLVISWGKGIPMAYIFDSPSRLLTDFFTFFGPRFSGAITPGIRIEIFLMLVVIFWFVFKIRKSTLWAVLAVIASYAAIFVFCALPSVVYAAASIFSPTVISEGVNVFWIQSVFHSALSFNSLNETFHYSTINRSFDIGFDKGMSQVLLLVGSALSAVWFFLSDSRTFKALAKNARPERLAHYLLLLVMGIAGGMITAGLSTSYGWIDIFGAIDLCVAIAAAWLSAVCLNDIEDESIDAISDPSRPLPSGSLDATSMRSAATIFFILSISAAWLAGYYQVFAVIIFSALYYAYSMSPFRLKRIPILSSFIISLVCLTTVFAGFFFTYPHKSLTAFPFLIAIGIVVVYTLAVNIRDLKDIEGDRAALIPTLPTMLGPAKRFPVVGGLFALAFFLAPYFLSTSRLYWFAIPFGIAGYFLVNKKPYREWPLFALGMVYLVIVGIVLYLSQ